MAAVVLFAVVQSKGERREKVRPVVCVICVLRVRAAPRAEVVVSAVLTLKWEERRE
jgi:hypothetical protein